MAQQQVGQVAVGGGGTRGAVAALDEIERPALERRGDGIAEPPGPTPRPQTP